MERQRYPIGQQNFENIRKEKKVYVDKTGLVFDLVREYNYVFLSRPRRFGKSLLLSTIQSYFEGREDLFRGLAIHDMEREWKRHPVFMLSLSRIDANDEKSLASTLSMQFGRWEEEYGITTKEDSLASRFSVIIETAFRKTGERVVVLVDEYDNPLINTLHKGALHESYRTLLKSIYSTLKDMDAYIRFGMLTGVSRFSRTTIFSGLNNLSDITFSDRYATICGFTEEEIRRDLWQGVENLAQKRKITAEAALEELKTAYDGYHFSEECPDMYNPFSLLLALAEERISDYWVTTATPEFLVEKLKNSRQNFTKIFNDKVSEKSLASIDTVFSSPVSLLFQTGYLTIKSYDAAENKFYLKVPNQEVERGLFPALLGAFVGQDEEDSRGETAKMGEFLDNGKPEEFLERCKIFLAGIPYSVMPTVSEIFFEHTMYLIFRTIPMEVEGESETAYGRRDIVVKTEKYIYIFELKLDGDAGAALRQIEEKGYALPYAHDGRHIIKIGVNFSSHTRNILDWQIQS